MVNAHPLSPSTDQDVLRESAEQRFAAELATLTADDQDQRHPLPPGWLRSPHAVRKFIIGDDKLGISRKFYGDDPLVDRAIVTLLGRQGLMLVGEPGTAKSMLSELLAAGISGNSNLTIQGTAGTSEDHLKYSWNYALLLAEGPVPRALVPSPVYQGMTEGKLVRFEEITRCPPEIQDVLVSLMSEKQMMIPEMGEQSRVSARHGFNLIATANLRDRGVHEMSAALKRRFNFETVRPIRDHAFEVELITSRLKRELGAEATHIVIRPDVITLLVTTFQELRAGTSKDGTAIKTPDAVMSTAEAVNIAYAAALEARYLGNGTLSSAGIARQLLGVVFKDNADDQRRMRHYVDTVVRERARKDGEWKAFFEVAKDLWA